MTQITLSPFDFTRFDIIQPYINLRDPRFGVVADGTTDDAAAIQDAIDAARELSGSDLVQAVPVWVPPGSYRVDTSLKVYSGTQILGAGETSQLIAGDDNSIIEPDTAGNAINVVIKGLSFSGRGGSGITTSTTRFSRSQIVDCHFGIDLVAGISVECIYLDIAFCKFGLIGTYTSPDVHQSIEIRNNPSSSWDANNVVSLRNNQINNARQVDWAVIISNGSMASLVGNTIEGAGVRRAAVLLEGLFDVRVSSLWMEQINNINTDQDPDIAYFELRSDTEATKVVALENLRISNTATDEPPKYLIRMADNTTNVAVRDSIMTGTTFDAISWVESSPAVYNQGISEYHNNHVNATSALPAFPVVPLEGVVQEPFFIGWSTGATQGWQKTASLGWAVASPGADYPGETVELTAGGSGNGFYRDVNLELVAGKRLVLKTLAKRVTDPGQKFWLAVNFDDPATGGDWDTLVDIDDSSGFKEYTATVVVPASPTAIHVGIYTGGATGSPQCEIAAFDVWVIEESAAMEPTFLVQADT